MTKLAVIVGFGGINAAGRSSGSHAYKRILADALSASLLTPTWHDLGHRMGLLKDGPLSPELIEAIKAGSLIRRIQSFDPEQILIHHQAELEQGSLQMKSAKLSQELRQYASIQASAEAKERIEFSRSVPVLLADHIKSQVSTAAELPTGFDPSALYHSHHHPKGLAMTVYGASDALNSLGFEWEQVLKIIKPDQVSVYAGSGLAQVDHNGFAGLFQQRLCGHRINSKMLPLSFAEMPADFINSYILNSVGATGNQMGACASFLYNLRCGIRDIQSGQSKVAFVGNSEAPIVFDVIDGFRVMGALATDQSLCELDQSPNPNHRRACRPFSTNTGFTIAESAQFFVLMDDELALSLGATIYGAVADVFVNADANKKSIASPGVGNYITFAKTAALAQAILGKTGLQQSYVQAHGTGTPQNRSSESHILNETAKTFGLHDWPVTAIKSYVGHSISAAAGDQLSASLGVWQYGWIPGIKTIDHLADDVQRSHLNILMEHQEIIPSELKSVLINSKGFGGNNASALILSPDQSLRMLTQRYGQTAMKAYWLKNEKVAENQQLRDAQTCAGQERIIYRFGESVMDAHSLSLSTQTLKLSEFDLAIDLPTVNPYYAYEP